MTFKVLDSDEANIAPGSSQSKSYLKQPIDADPLAAVSSMVFARSSGISLGKADGATIEERAADVWRLAGDKRYQRLHVWRRDLVGPDFHGKVVEPPPSVAEVEAAIRAAAGQSGNARRDVDPSQPTHPGDLVLDCVIVEPDEWWIGWHEGAQHRELLARRPLGLACSTECRLAGVAQNGRGPCLVRLADRARRSVREIGSAPGGASQALLGHGVQVIGIDPADMDPRVLADPGFVHWKKRGADVRRREFRKVRWLMADLNVAPAYTLDTVEAIVTHPEVHVHGMILTLKLLEWSLAAEILAYLERVRSWGFGRVAARQLHHNRQEICVSALKGRPRTRHI